MVLVKRIRRGGQQQHDAHLDHGKQRHTECFPVVIMCTKQVHVVLRKAVGGRASRRVPARSREGRNVSYGRLEVRSEVRIYVPR